MEESFRNFMWHKGTTQAEGQILSDSTQPCDIEQDKILDN